MEVSMSTATELRGPEVEKSVQIPAQIKDPRQTPPPAMQMRAEWLFSDVLLESSGLQRQRRTWAAVLSFVVQCLLLGVLLIVPLMFTDVLPQEQLLTFLMAPPPPPPPEGFCGPALGL